MNKNHFENAKAPVCLHILGQDLVNQMHSHGRAMQFALRVITKNKSIREWLAANDPNALAQCENALNNE